MKTLDIFSFSKNSMAYLFFAIITTFTMWGSSSLFTDPHILPQWYSFVGVALIWTIVYFICSRTTTVKISSFSLALTVFLLYVLIHSLLSNWNINLLTIPCFFFLFLMFQSSDDKNFEIFKKIIIVFVLCQTISGFLQYMHIVSNGTSFPIVGSFDNPAGYAGCMVASLPFCLFSWNFRNRWGILSIVSTLLILITLVLSESRAGILCVIIIIIYYYYYKIAKNYSRKEAILIGSIFILVLAIVLGLGSKQNSAIGRLLIWENAVEMFKDAPVFGHGANSFQIEYMNYQAGFFEDNPNHPYAELADNVLHPFNEYMLLITEHGIVGALLLLVVLVILIWKQKQFSPFVLSLIGIGSFALFSYPLKYTYVLVVMALCCGQIAKEMDLLVIFKVSTVGRIITIGVSIVMLYFLFEDIDFEYRWKRTVRESRRPMNHALDNYVKLYEAWNGDPLFLYNYGAYLNQQKQYNESNRILFECKKYLNDYDVQFIIANNYYYLGKWNDAKARYICASNMCPNRFVPLYQLFNIYCQQGKTEKAKQIGEMILVKPVKIVSPTVNQIKAEVADHINSLDNE